MRLSRTLLMVSMLWLPVSAAQAQIAPVCDPNFMSSLQAKAMAEINREIQVNNSVITKPPSVLALSCFDSHLNKMGATNGTQVSAGGNDALVDILNNTIGSSFTTYYEKNFANEPIDMSGAISFESTGGDFGTCDNLAKFWAKVKCDVADGKLVGTMTDFSAFSQSSDVRDLTGGDGACGSAGAPAKLQDSYASGYLLSNDMETSKKNYGDQYFDTARPNFCTYAPKPGNDPFADVTVCSFTATNGSKEDRKCDKIPAIPTGLAVQYNVTANNGPPKSTPIWSYTCINPGCYFDVQKNINRIDALNNATPPAMFCSPKPTGTGTTSGG
jgi:hypothetical protein